MGVPNEQVSEMPVTCNLIARDAADGTRVLQQVCHDLVVSDLRPSGEIFRPFARGIKEVMIPLTQLRRLDVLGELQK